MMNENENGNTVQGDGTNLIAAGVPKGALIFLHGLGDSADGWSFLAQNIYERDHVNGTNIAPSIDFFFPTAIKRRITMNGGMMMNAWADMHTITEDTYFDQLGYKESVERIHKIIDSEIARGVPPNKIIVGGFSQGASLAYLSVPSYPKPLGGMLGISGWLPSMKSTAWESFMHPNSTKLNAPPFIYHAHGEDDRIIAYATGEKTANILASRFVESKLIFESLPGIGHTVTKETLISISDFLIDIWDTNNFPQ